MSLRDRIARRVQPTLVTIEDPATGEKFHFTSLKSNGLTAFSLIVSNETSQKASAQHWSALLEQRYGLTQKVPESMVPFLTLVTAAAIVDEGEARPDEVDWAFFASQRGEVFAAITEALSQSQDQRTIEDGLKGKSPGSPSESRSSSDIASLLPGSTPTGS